MSRAASRSLADRVTDYFVRQQRRYGKKLVDTPETRQAVSQMFQRSMDAGEFALPVMRRAATRELFHLERLLQNPRVRRVIPVPSGSAGRTPDFVIQYIDSRWGRLEITALTGAPRGRTLDLRRIRELIGSVPAGTFGDWLTQQTRAWSGRDLEGALWRKIHRGQLTERLVVGGHVIPADGAICISLPAHGGAAVAEQSIAQTLQGPLAIELKSRDYAFLSRIEFDLVESGGAGTQRKVVVYARGRNGRYSRIASPGAG